MKENKRVLSLLVNNNAGVLSRISGLFSRRGYNIDSLSVGVTADPRYSRMTVVCTGEELILEQITKQLKKQVDVRDIKVLDPEDSVCREMIMVKISTGASREKELLRLLISFVRKLWMSARIPWLLN